MKKTLSIALLLFALLICLSAAFFYGRYQNKTGNLTRITLVGESQAKIAPDTAVLTFSVVTQNKVAVEAQQENARKTEAVIKAMEAVATDPKPEIKTEDYILDPEESWKRDMPVVLGYTAKNSVTVQAKDLKNVGSLVDAATKAGANSVGGIQFVIRDDSPTQGDAIGIATKQAMAKAEAIAQSLGGRVYRIVEMQEGGAQRIPTGYDHYGSSNAASTVANADYRTPIRAGSLDVHSRVTLVIEIERKI